MGYFCDSVAAQDDSESSNRVVESERIYDNPIHERLYQKVLTQLKKMKPADHSADASVKTGNQVDWFVVGGSLTDKQTGQIEGNFNTFQGVADVAKRIVDFQFGTHGSRTPTWRVLNRYSDSAEATSARNEAIDDFRIFLARRNSAIQRQRQFEALADSQPRRSGFGFG